MKYSKVVGILACIILFVSCFLPWTYHADLHKTFTGFFSEQNIYGKPGKFLCFFALVSIYLIWINRVWAKRVHLFLSALFVGYTIKTFTLFASCYNAYCPEKKYGIYLMLASSIVIMLSAIFPNIKLKEQN